MPRSIEGIGRRLVAGGLLFLLSVNPVAAWAQAPVFPDRLGTDKLGVYEKKAPATLMAPDRELYDEFGLEASEQAEYSDPNKKLASFTGTAWRFHDSTGAYAMFEYRRPVGVPAPDFSTLASRTGDGVFYAVGNYVFAFSGPLFRSGLPNIPEVMGIGNLYSQLPKFSNAPLPAIRDALPTDGLVAYSERYILGPVSLNRFLPQVPPSVAAFRFGSEAQLGKYKTPKGSLTLAVFNYPTPTMARDQAVEFQKIPKAVVKRTGSLIAVTVDPPDADFAERLLAKINYQADVTVNEKTPGSDIRKFGGTLFNIVALATMLILLSVIAGIGFGGFRLLGRKIWKKNDPDAMITLDIRERL